MSYETFSEQEIRKLYDQIDELNAKLHKISTDRSKLHGCLLAVESILQSEDKYSDSRPRWNKLREIIRRFLTETDCQSKPRD